MLRDSRQYGYSVSIRLPESLHKRAKELASEDNISMNQLITLALAEKISALDTAAYLEKRVQQGNREKFLKVLEKIKDIEPEEYDRL